MEPEAVVRAVARMLEISPEAVADILAGRAYVEVLDRREDARAPVVHVTSARLSYRQKVVAVVRAKGGVGATSAAIGLAAAFARDVKTLLCDFSFQDAASDLAHYLGLDRPAGVPDLGFFDGGGLEECLVRADKNLFVLLSPRHAGDGEMGKAARAVEAARRDFDAVVLDLPERLPQALFDAAGLCNAAVAVTSGLAPELVRLAVLLKRLRFRDVVVLANACSLPRQAAELFDGAAVVRAEEDGQLARSFERGELPREKSAFMKAMLAVRDALYEADRRRAAQAL